MRALFVVDLQHDFKQLVTSEMISRISEMVKFSRENNIEIFWIYSIYEDNTEKSIVIKENRLEGTHIGKTKFCIKGTTGAKFINEIEEMIKSNDNIVEKKYYSAFKETNLLNILISKFISEILFCGVTTNTCVLATAMHASNNGFCITLLSDCCNAFDNKKHLYGISEFKKLKSNRIVASNELIKIDDSYQ